MTLAAVMTGSALFVLNGHTTGVLLPSIDRELGVHESPLLSADAPGIEARLRALV